jgi:mono/diheme cytochrome c family protein
MAQNPSTRVSPPVVIALVLLVVIAVVFLIAVFAFSTQPAAEPLTNEQLETAAAQLAANGDAANGETLVNSAALGCAACHIIAAQSGVAPPFAGVATVAATRNPDLSATAYLYESIINPAAYLVEGYQNSMPANFSSRISDEEMGDILAYLLTLTAP